MLAFCCLIPNPFCCLSADSQLSAGHGIGVVDGRKYEAHGKPFAHLQNIMTPKARLFNKSIRVSSLTMGLTMTGSASSFFYAGADLESIKLQSKFFSFKMGHPDEFL